MHPLKVCLGSFWELGGGAAVNGKPWLYSTVHGLHPGPLPEEEGAKDLERFSMRISE